jgi:hypothetical protein
MPKLRIALIVSWLFIPFAVLSGMYLYDSHNKLKREVVEKESLVGPDVNANQIRDDVEEALSSLKWAGKQYQAAADYAAKLQHYMLLRNTDVNALYSASKDHSCSAMQMHRVFPKSGAVSAYDAVNGVFNIVMNSETRQQAYLKNELVLDSANLKKVDLSDCGLS